MRKCNKEDRRRSKGSKTVPQEWAWRYRIKRRRENSPWASRRGLKKSKLLKDWSKIKIGKSCYSEIRISWIRTWLILLIQMLSLEIGERRSHAKVVPLMRLLSLSWIGRRSWESRSWRESNRSRKSKESKTTKSTWRTRECTSLKCISNNSEMILPGGRRRCLRRKYGKQNPFSPRYTTRLETEDQSPAIIRKTNRSNWASSEAGLKNKCTWRISNHQQTKAKSIWANRPQRRKPKALKIRIILTSRIQIL